jgi:hypothetical protein
LHRAHIPQNHGGRYPIIKMTRHKPNIASKTPSARSNVVERLFADKVWTTNYRVTAEEQETLSNAAMMGEVTCERDVLFILNQLRRARLRW